MNRTSPARSTGRLAATIAATALLVPVGAGTASAAGPTADEQPTPVRLEVGAADQESQAINPAAAVLLGILWQRCLGPDAMFPPGSCT